MLFLLLSSMICFVGCNQSNNNSKPDKKKEIVITIQGDEHVAEGKNVTFKVAKDSKWETVKSHEKIKAVKFADNYELDKWKQDNATGTDLADTYVFATDKTIYAVSKTKNVPSTDITITIQGDEHVAEGKNVTFKVAKDSKWETVKSHEKIKAVKFADNYELDKWKQDNATGTDLSDAYVFATDKTIYAVSKTKVQQLTPEDIFEWDADEGEGFLKRKESFDKENLPETLVIPNKLNDKDVTMLVGGFANCTKIKMIDFSQCTALIAIGTSAFEGCTNLEGKITLPASLTTIQTNAFQGCAKITELDFSACTALESLAGFNECAGLTTVDLSKCTALKTIDSSAFSECKALKTVNFPVSLEKLENTFTECIELEIVDLSKCTSLKEIGFKTFYNCKKASIKLPDITRLKLTATSFGEITGGGEDKLCKTILTAKGDKGDALKELIKRKAKYPEERIKTYE